MISTATQKTYSIEKKDQNLIVSLSVYRKLTGDRKTANEIVEKRIKYMEAMCRNVIRQELNKYAS